MRFIDLKKQFFLAEDRIRARMDAVLEHGQFILGPEVAELENQLKSITGAKHCLTCASGSTALDLIMLAWQFGPGDAVLIPSLWWHAIDALDGVNVLVNYWWRRAPDWMDAPLNALMAGLLAIRQLPAHERAHWKRMFEHYVFDADDTTAAHIPETARGVLAPFDEAGAANLRRVLRQRLER